MNSGLVLRSGPAEIQIFDAQKTAATLTLADAGALPFADTFIPYLCSNAERSDL